MSTIGRIQVATMVTIGLTILGVIFQQAIPPIVDLADPDGMFSFLLDEIEVVVPVVVVSVLLAVWVWVIIGSVVRQRRKDRVVRR